MSSLLRDALSSRRALRQAIILHEILGPPKALQSPGDEISSLPDGRPPILNGEPRDDVDQISDRNGSATRERDPPSGGEP